MRLFEQVPEKQGRDGPDMARIDVEVAEGFRASRIRSLQDNQPASREFLPGQPQKSLDVGGCHMLDYLSREQSIQALVRSPFQILKHVGELDRAESAIGAEVNHVRVLVNS